VIVPVVAGIMLNSKFGKFALAHKVALRNFDQSIILLIVYTSFCDSFHKKMFDGFPMSDIVMLSIAMVGLFFFAMAIVWGLCKAMHFNREDTITAVFCGSKKSLVHGSVMSKVLFSNPAIIGVVLLPTMLYHAYQLIIVSIIAKKLGKNAD
jgi:sodium/bile acid cotransporter 7